MNAIVALSIAPHAHLSLLQQLLVLAHRVGEACPALSGFASFAILLLRMPTISVVVAVCAMGNIIVPHVTRPIPQSALHSAAHVILGSPCGALVAILRRRSRQSYAKTARRRMAPAITATARLPLQRHGGVNARSRSATIRFRFATSVCGHTSLPA